MRKTLVVVVAAACGGNSVALSNLATQLKAALCTNAVTCGQAPDQATCLANFGAFYSSDEFLTTVADAQAGKIKYDANLGAACVDEIKAQGCTFSGFNASASNPCNKMFSGTVATGAACVEASECAAGNNCTFTMCDPTATCCTGAMAGTCTARAASGATCQADSDCGDGLYCSDPTFSGSGTCKAQGTTAGAACDTSLFGACANPYYCNIDFNTTPAAGTCKVPAAHGAACTTTDDLPCIDARDYCDASTLKCTSRIAIGMACTPAARSCVLDAICDATSNKCVALATVGQPCTVDASFNANCLGDSACMNGTSSCMSGQTGCTCQLPAAGMVCR